MRDRTREAQIQARRAETVRLVLTRRERAPRSPKMERALKRLIWRYTLSDTKISTEAKGSNNVSK